MISGSLPIFNFFFFALLYLHKLSGIKLSDRHKHVWDFFPLLTWGVSQVEGRGRKRKELGLGEVGDSKSRRA